MWPNKFTWKGCYYWRYLYMNKTLSPAMSFLWSYSEIKCYVYYINFFAMENTMMWQIYHHGSKAGSGESGRGSVKGNSSHLYSNTSQWKRKKFMINDCFKTGRFLSKTCPSVGGTVVPAYITVQDRIITYGCPCTAMLLANGSSQCCFVSCESIPAVEQTHTAYVTAEGSQQSIMAPCYVTNSSVLDHRNCLTLFLVSPTSFLC